MSPFSRFFWLIFNWGEIELRSGFRYFLALIVGSIVLSGLGRISIILLAQIRDTLNEHYLEAQAAASGATLAMRKQRKPRSALGNALLAPFRQNYAALIMFVSVFLMTLLLIKFGPVVPIAAIYLLLLLIYSVFKALVYFTIIWRCTIVVLTVLWISVSGFVTNALGI